MPRRPVYLGFSAAELIPTVVAERSLRRATPGGGYDVQRIDRAMLQGAYTRPTTVDETTRRLYDEISQAPMSTEHAIARFFIPWLQNYCGWALFTDGDVLFRRSLDELFAFCDDRYAVMCVQHAPLNEVGYKKDHALQLPYARKNWSSVMLINCGHTANRWLDLEHLNTVPGRDLHRFCWLAEAEIGCLPKEWNHLIGVQPYEADPAIAHFTSGTPDLPDYAHCAFSDEWYAVAEAAGYRLPRPVHVVEEVI